MPIEIRNDLPAAVSGSVAATAGYGQFQLEQQKLAMQRAQQQAELGMQAAQMQQRSNLAQAEMANATYNKAQDRQLKQGYYDQLGQWHADTTQFKYDQQDSRNQNVADRLTAQGQWHQGATDAKAFQQEWGNQQQTVAQFRKLQGTLTPEGEDTLNQHLQTVKAISDDPNIDAQGRLAAMRKVVGAMNASGVQGMQKKPDPTWDSGIEGVGPIPIDPKTKMPDGKIFQGQINKVIADQRATVERERNANQAEAVKQKALDAETTHATKLREAVAKSAETFIAANPKMSAEDAAAKAAEMHIAVAKTLANETHPHPDGPDAHPNDPATVKPPPTAAVVPPQVLQTLPPEVHGLPMPRSKAEFDALEPGTRYTYKDESGNVFTTTKPGKK